MSDTAADMQEQEARIRQLSNDAMLKALESLRREQEIRHAPITLFAGILAAGLAGGAALLGAALALLKFLTH